MNKQREKKQSAAVELVIHYAARQDETALGQAMDLLREIFLRRLCERES